MAKYIFNKSDIIVSVSDVMTSKILKYFPDLKSKILTQQYGVDINFLDKFDSNNKDITISTNRQWKPNSNYPIILEALQYFKECELKIIGAYDDKYSSELLTQYSDLAHYSTGIISYEQNISYVAQSKIFISLTSSDGMPLSLVEAMYLGAIPIVSNILPNQELIKNGINGFIVPINSKDLKAKIEEVLNLSNEKIKEIQRYNKDLVLDKFDFEKNFNKLNTVLNKAIDEKLHECNQHKKAFRS
jgi:glycosyltransferase involved in cell wall biosynthesis